jgi:tetratricopeptide (TPR) repeat protein
MTEPERREGEQFEELKDLWQRAIEAGQLEQAEEIIARAWAWASAHGDERQIDSAACAQAAVAIQLGRGEAELPRLREILLRSSDPANCRLAAYHISAHYHIAKNYKKSAFYARIALDRARLLGRRDWLASCHNQLGNALLSDSSIEEASREYEKAAELISSQPSLWRGWIAGNLGYCRILQARYAEGYPLLYESLALFQRYGAERYQVVTRLDLSFAHLETGRYRHARRHGAAALALAEKAGWPDAVKNALYLLGEAANLSGDPATAHRHFSRLQGDFYPEASYLPGFLMAVDVRKLVNLHA